MSKMRNQKNQYVMEKAEGQSEEKHIAYNLLLLQLKLYWTLCREDA